MTKGVPALRFASVKGVGVTVTDDWTVTVEGALLYEAGQASTVSVIV